MNPLYAYAEQYAGESVPSKLARLREALRAKRCDALVIAELDEIGWLLNIRGTDVDYTPCVIAYCVVEMDRCTLFVDPRKLPSSAPVEAEKETIVYKPYEEVFAYLQNLQATGVLFDGNRVNEALYEAINPAVTRRVNATPSPLQVMMSVKNEVELAGERKAMRTDAVALTRFFKWLEEEKGVSYADIDF